MDFDKKNLCFCSKVFGRVVQNTFDVSSGTLTEQIFRMEVLETRGFSKNFWSFRDKGGKIFQTWQNSNRCPREQFMKNFFQKRKIRSFFRFWANVYFQRNPQSVYPWKFLGKTIFEIYIIFHIFFGLWSKKRLVGKRIFSLVVTTAIRASRDIFWEEDFYKKKDCLFIRFGFWAIFLVYWQKTVRVSEKQPTNTEKSWTKKMVEKLFFFQNIFGFRAENFEQLDKRYSQDCQNSIQSVQRNLFRTFFWHEETQLMVFGRLAKLLNFWYEFWVKSPKTVAYGCSGTFKGSFGEKSNSLTVFGLWGKVTIFWQKNSAGC